MSRPAPLGRDSFPLLDDVIAFTDIAMSSRSRFASLELLTQGLGSVLRTRFELPKYLLVPDPWKYVRHELHRSARHGYQIIAITWAPGQGSGIHDHGNTWGVEAVLSGRLEVTDYVISEEKDAWVRMDRQEQRALHKGTVISLLPPHDMHACRNPSHDQTAVSLHIYGRPLEQVRRFVSTEEDLYRQDRTQLHVV